MKKVCKFLKKGLTDERKSGILISVRKYRKNRAVRHPNGKPHKSCMPPEPFRRQGADYTIQGE